MVGANASRQSRAPRERLEEAAQVSRTVKECIAELEKANPAAGPEMVSTSDPDAIWATKGGPAMMACYDNYLIDTGEPGHSRGRSHAGTFSSGNGSCTKNDRTSREVRSPTGESGSRQGIGEWRVSRMAVDAGRATSYSCDRFVVIRPVAASPATSFAMNRKKTPAYEHSQRTRYKDRGSVRRTETTDAFGASATAPIMECLRAVLVSCYCTECETSSAIPGSAAAVAYAEHPMTTGNGRSNPLNGAQHQNRTSGEVLP